MATVTPILKPVKKHQEPPSAPPSGREMLLSTARPQAGLIGSKNERPTPARNGKYQVHRTGAVDSKNKDKCIGGASHRHRYDVFKILTMK